MIQPAAQFSGQTGAQAQAGAGAVVEVRGLSKVFFDFWLRPRVRAVEDLDLEVRPHEVFGLLGPNGSGKSTTIKILLGLLFATRGRVAIFGKLPTDVAIKKRLGYLPEETYLYRFLSAEETLDYYGRLFHLDRRTRRRRTGMLLEMVGLEAVARRPVGEYSKGMQRRIGLAQALINDPDLLILDEPTSGLDPIGTRQIKDLILELRRRGKTVLLSSHLLADVEDVCDRLVILYGGRKRAEGTVDQLLRRSDSTLIETDALKPETIQMIEKIIEQEEGKAIRRVEAPRQRLEQLFLQIVEQARAEGAATSGAVAGGQLAGFLAQALEGRGLIEQLVSAAAPPTPAAAPAPPRTLEEQTIQEEAQEVLHSLEGGAAGARPAAPSAPSDEEKKGELPVDEEAKRIVDELLGGGGGKS